MSLVQGRAESLENSRPMERTERGQRDTELILNRFDFEFKPNAKVVIIYYELVNRQYGWKVNGPISDYPDISAEVLVKSLRTSAENLRESPER
jgi:hypothetical protein